MTPTLQRLLVYLDEKHSNVNEWLKKSDTQLLSMFSVMLNPSYDASNTGFRKLIEKDYMEQEAMLPENLYGVD